MSAHRVLLAYVDLFRRFNDRLSHPPMGVEGTFESGLGFLMKQLRLKSASLFRWNAANHSLVMQYILQDRTLLEAEEEIVVDAASPLKLLVAQRVPVIVSSRRPWSAYLPLEVDGSLVGAVRIDRAAPLPAGRVLRALTPWTGAERNPKAASPLLEDIADILSTRFEQLIREEGQRKTIQTMRAGSDVAAAVFERPRLRDMLEAVAESIVKNLGFDRIRFYLADASRRELRGVLGLQFPGRPIDLTGEVHPLKPSQNGMASALLSGVGGAPVTAMDGRLAYVRLSDGADLVGAVTVDNLLSQQILSPEQLEGLASLARQIGMAIVNARLFEDIEQQAITDGLTKLYVYRYFQQRLKEELERADRYSYGMALIMMDVDRFKSLNDTYGHQTGDRVLEFISQTIRANIRRIDLAARYGGDEFVMLLPEINEKDTWLIANRLLNALRNCPLQTPSGESLPVTVTLGIAMYPADARSGRDLIESADRALYWAKKHNKGDMCFYRSVSAQIQKPA